MSGAPIGIPFTAVAAYADRYGVGGEAFHTLLRFVRALDDEWRSWWHEQQPKDDP